MLTATGLEFWFLFLLGVLFPPLPPMALTISTQLPPTPHLVLVWWTKWGFKKKLLLFITIRRPYLIMLCAVNINSVKRQHNFMNWVILIPFLTSGKWASERPPLDQGNTTNKGAVRINPSSAGPSLWPCRGQEVAAGALGSLGAV